MAKLLQSLGRSSKVFLAVSAGASFGSRLKVDSSGFVRVLSCNMGESANHDDRIDRRASRSVTDKIEGTYKRNWDITTYLAPTGSTATVPNAHNLFLMAFGGPTSYVSAGSGDLHTYYFSAGQTANPIGFIMQSYDNVMQRTMRSAYVRTVQFELSNGVPKVTFEGGGTRYGVSGGPGNLPVSCGSAGQGAGGGGGGGYLFEDMPGGGENPAGTEIFVDAGDVFDEDALIQLPSEDNFQVITRAAKIAITVTDYLSAGSFDLYVNNTKYTLTEGVDYTSDTSNANTATSVGVALNLIPGVTGSSSSTIAEALATDPTLVTSLGANTTAGGLTINDLVSITMDSEPAGGGLTGDLVSLYEPPVPSVVDTPVSGVVGSVTWTDLENNSSRTDVRLTEFELTIDQALEEHADEILNKDVVEISYGWRKVSGSLKFRASKIWINQFIAAKQRKFSAFVIELGNIDGYKVALDLDKVYFTEWEIISPEVEDAMFHLSFEALGSSPATADRECKLIFR